MQVVVQVATQLEWQALQAHIAEPLTIADVPVGQAAPYQRTSASGTTHFTLLHGGIGKVRAAASTQYALLTWRPDLHVLLGTAGAVDPTLAELDVILAERTVIYDFAVGTAKVRAALILHHTTELPGPWDERAFPFPTRRGTLLTGDGDVLAKNVQRLRKRFTALTADWESGAVAKVCALNQVACLILRGVSDIPDGPAAGQLARYRANTPHVMARLWETLVVCVEQFRQANPSLASPVERGSAE